MAVSLKSCLLAYTSVPFKQFYVGGGFLSILVVWWFSSSIYSANFFGTQVLVDAMIKRS